MVLKQTLFYVNTSRKLLSEKAHLLTTLSSDGFRELDSVRT